MPSLPAPPLPPSSTPKEQETMSSPLVSAPLKETKLSPLLKQIVVSKQTFINLKKRSLDVQYTSAGEFREKPMLRHRHRTNPMIWCAAILCLIFSLLVIFFGIATSIIFLVIKPRSPLFDTPAANLNVIYFDSPEHFNGDLTFLANFTNPNRKLDVRFEYAKIELYFSDNLIATQALQPFNQRRRQTRLVPVHLISSLVYLPQHLAMGLQKQVISNRISYNIRGTFKVRVNLGLFHVSYTLYGTCLLQMTSPPTGVLITRSCRTKK